MEVCEWWGETEVWGAERRAGRRTTWPVGPDRHRTRRLVITPVLHAVFSTLYLAPPPLSVPSSRSPLLTWCGARALENARDTPWQSSGERSPWRRPSVGPWQCFSRARPYRVCQRECLSVCVLVSVSLTEEAGARPEWGRGRDSVAYHAHALAPAVCFCLFVCFICKKTHTHNVSWRCSDRWTGN